jgi:phage FluMu protein Com
MRQFQCKKCNTEYEELVPYDETRKYSKVKCPKCKSKSKIVLMSGFTFNFTSNASEGTKWYNASHDRRYFHKLEKDRKNREEAEKKSHMGSDPYPHLDDISSGNFFGKVQ